MDEKGTEYQSIYANTLGKFGLCINKHDKFVPFMIIFIIIHTSFSSQLPRHNGLKVGKIVQ